MRFDIVVMHKESSGSYRSNITDSRPTWSSHQINRFS